jgi:ribosomal protein S18 acetylase RimI-like enzyme
MQIRDARPGDTDFIFNLGDSEFTKYGEHGGLKCTQGMKSANAITLVCEDDSTQQRLGFAIVAFWEGPYLFGVATVPERRRSGVARTLVEECVRRVPLRFGHTELVLHVWDGNLPGLSLFESLGFCRTPEPRGYPRRWAGVPGVAIRMVRQCPVLSS